MAQDEITALHRARAAAHEVERVAAQLAEFADRLSAVLGPAEMAEYDTLIGREAAAISDRVEAFQDLGLRAPSIDATANTAAAPAEADDVGWD